MMQDTIQTINQTEAEARQIVIDAQSRAAEIIGEAEKEAGQIKAAALKRAKEITSEKHAEDVKAADTQSVNYASETDRETGAFEAEAAAKKAEAVEAVLNMIV